MGRRSKVCRPFFAGEQIFMVIAVATEWGDDFDRFAYYKIEMGKVRESEVVRVAPGGADKFAAQLNGLEADLLIAPKVSDELRSALDNAGVILIAGHSGRADIILKSYLTGTLF